MRRKFPAIPHTSIKPPPSNCHRCGSGAHPRHLCPTKEATCYRCNRRGQYSSQCLSNTVAVISATPQPPKQNQRSGSWIQLRAGIQGNIWEVKVMIRDKVVLFKVDTGADIRRNVEELKFDRALTAT